MRILFVRHAKALEREEWNDDDLLRPLSDEGREKARSFFTKLPEIYPIDVIVSSKAVRAVQTAELLKEVYPNAKYFETSKLNPGASPIAFEEMIEKFRGYENVALVGHEPDISLAVAHFSGCDELHIKVRKAGIIEMRGEEYFTLQSILYPKLLRSL